MNDTTDEPLVIDARNEIWNAIYAWSRAGKGDEAPAAAIKVDEAIQDYALHRVTTNEGRAGRTS